MVRRSDEELKPRKGDTLIVGIACRISGCPKQKELSLEDQEDNAKEIVTDLFDGPAEFRTIATKGKGEWLTRPELQEIEAAYRSRAYDLFVYDDLGRLVRGGEAARLLGVGVDHGTRSICINDGIDTIDPTWEEDALNACSENVAHVERTSKRIKQKTMNRFKRFGATPKRPIYGYIVPDGATSFDDWMKDPAAEPFIVEGKRILRATLNGEAVASYFRKNSVPTGPLAKNDDWDGTMVLRFYRNPILKGMPQRGVMATEKVHETGKRVSRKNPKGPTHYEAPHLAYFDPAEFDELVAALAEHNKPYCRKLVDGVDPRANVPRKRTRFPGQHARCWYCGRTYNWGGNGNIGHLMCSGSHKYLCWNSVHIDGALVVERVQAVMTDVLYQLEGFDDQFRQIVDVARHGTDDSDQVQLKQIAAELAVVEREKANLVAAVKACGPGMFLEEVEKLKAKAAKLERRRRLIEMSADRPLVLPETIGELRGELEAQFQPLAVESAEFGALLRQIVPELDVYLVRLLDGGRLEPRARVKVKFSGIAPDVARIPQLDDLLTRVVTIDLFEPPQRERIRAEAAGHKGLHQRQIAAAIKEKPKQQAVQKALALHRMMRSLNLESPYVMVHEPPEDLKKMRRHRHSKYRFTPVEGYVPSEL